MTRRDETNRNLGLKGLNKNEAFSFLFFFLSRDEMEVGTQQIRYNSKKLTLLLRVFGEVSSSRIMRQSGETTPGHVQLWGLQTAWGQWQEWHCHGYWTCQSWGWAQPSLLAPSLFVPSQNAMQLSESSISSHNTLTELSQSATCESLPLGICNMPKAVFTKKRWMHSLTQSH